MKTFKPSWLGPPLPPRPKARPAPGGPPASGDPFYYSRPWRALRAMKARLNPLCERCEARGIVRALDIVHHVIPRRDRPDLELDLSNLESVCLPCHNRIDHDTEKP